MGTIVLLAMLGQPVTVMKRSLRLFAFWLYPALFGVMGIDRRKVRLLKTDDE